MNLAKVWWFVLLLAGVLLLIYGVLIAGTTLFSCGLRGDCSSYAYQFPGVDPWVLVIGFTDLGVALVLLSVNRLGKIVAPAQAS
jgi:hypothetical protein